LLIGILSAGFKRSFINAIVDTLDCSSSRKSSSSSSELPRFLNSVMYWIFSTSFSASGKEDSSVRLFFVGDLVFKLEIF